MELLKHIAKRHDESEIEVNGDGHSGNIQDLNMKKECFRKDKLFVFKRTRWTRANCKCLHEQTSDEI